MKCFAIAVWALGMFLQPASAGAQTQVIFEHAAQALQAGDYPAAESGFRKVLRAEPGNLGALGNLGVVYSHTNRYARAIDVYKQALRTAPQDRGILLNLGLVYLKQDDYQHALPYFLRLHRSDPGNLQATNLLATCLVYGGKPVEALELLKPLVDEKPDPATLYLLGVAYSRSGQAEAGERVFAVFSDASTRAQSNFLLGQAYYDSAAEAEQAYKDALNTDPNFPGTHRELAKVYIRLKREMEAHKGTGAGVATGPAGFQCNVFSRSASGANGTLSRGIAVPGARVQTDARLVGVCLLSRQAKLKMKDAEGAIQLLQQAADINPEEPSIYYLLATALKMVGRSEDAKQALRRVNELHTNSLDAEKRALRDAHVVGAR